MHLRLKEYEKSTLLGPVSCARSCT